jgi:hypothetical protein
VISWTRIQSLFPGYKVCFLDTKFVSRLYKVCFRLQSFTSEKLNLCRYCAALPEPVDMGPRFEGFMRDHKLDDYTPHFRMLGVAFERDLLDITVGALV